VACWSTKAAISLKRVKIEEKLLWRAYRKSSTLFRMVPSPTPMTSPSSRLRFTTPTKTSIAISQEWLRLCISNFLCTFKNFQGTHIKGASRGHLCDSTAFLYLVFAAVCIEDTDCGIGHNQMCNRRDGHFMLNLFLCRPT